MEYFELFQSSKVENAIEIVGLDTGAYCYRMEKKDFDELDRLKVAYYSGREYEELCDVLKEPAFLVSDRLKHILEVYDRKTQFKGVKLFSTDEGVKEYPLYWVPFFQETDCLHEKTQKYENGFLKELILDKKKIEGLSVFRIGNILEYKVIVSLPVAESILRRRFYGVELRKSEVI